MATTTSSSYGMWPFTQLLLTLLVVVSLFPFSSFACPNNCSSHGVCQSNSHCQCDPLFLSDDCSVSAEMQPVVLGTNDSFTMYWRVVEDLLHMRISAKTDMEDNVLSPQNSTDHGWAAVMFGAMDGMTDGWVFRVSYDELTDRAQAIEMYSTGFVEPTPYMDSSLTNITGFLTELGIDVSFCRQLGIAEKSSSSSYTPYAFSKSATLVLPVSWAWGVGVDPMIMHAPGHHGMLKLNLIRQEIVTQQDITFYASAGAVFGVVCLLGLLMQMPELRRSCLGRCCLHRRLTSRWLGCSCTCCNTVYRARRKGAERLPTEERDEHFITPSKSPFTLSSCCYSLLSFVTVGVVPTLLSMTYGELVLVSLYFTAVTAFIVTAYHSFVAFASDPSLLTGHLTALHLALTLLPTTQKSFFFYIFSMPFERAIAYHRYCSRMAYICLCTHMILMIQHHPDHLHILRSFTHTTYGRGVAWGFAAFISITMMLLFSLQFIRRRWFEVFYYIHMMCLLPTLLFTALHSIHFRYFAVVPFTLWCCDHLRSMQHSHQSVTLCDISLTAGERDRAVKLTIRVSPTFFRMYRAGQYVWVNLPQLSLLQWHPYSICAVRHGDGGKWVDVDICVLDSGPGTWSRQIADWIVQTHQLALQENTQTETGKHKHTDDDLQLSDQEEGEEEEAESAQHYPATSHTASTDTHSQSSASSDSSTASHSLSPPHDPTAVNGTNGLVLSSRSSLLAVSMDGPYGKLSVDVLRYSTLIMVCGGIGVTPMMGIAQWLLIILQRVASHHQHPNHRQHHKHHDDDLTLEDNDEDVDGQREAESTASSASCCIQHVYLIWTSRNLTFFTHLFPTLLYQLTHSPYFTVLLYNTHGDVQPGRIAKSQQVALYNEEDSGGANPNALGTITVYSGRPNILRLFDWIEREQRYEEDGDTENGGGKHTRQLYTQTHLPRPSGGDANERMIELPELKSTTELEAELDDEDDGENEEFSLDLDDVDFNNASGEHTHHVSSPLNSNSTQPPGTAFSVACLVCGPPSLMEDVEKVAMQKAFDLHKETFLL